MFKIFNLLLVVTLSSSLATAQDKDSRSKTKAPQKSKHKMLATSSRKHRVVKVKFSPSDLRKSQTEVGEMPSEAVEEAARTHSRKPSSVDGMLVLDETDVVDVPAVY